MKRVLYLCCLMLFSINGIAQYTDDPNFDVAIDDNFDISPRSWDNKFIDSEDIWNAYFKATGITHGDEHQAYQRSHAVFDTINDMMLLISEYKSDTNMDCDDVEFPINIECNISDNHSLRYFSGAMESRQKSFLYGYFEIRCKLPVHTGAFPAFWLWGACQDGDIDCTSPHYEEIDIFEYSWGITYPINNPDSHGEGDPRCITAGMYYNDTIGNYENAHHVSKIYTRVSDDKPSMDQWNTFGCLWMPDKVIWYLNGEEFNSCYERDSIPKHPLYLIANYAINNYSITINGNDTVFYPYSDTMYIDYIRAYNPIWDCDDSVLIETQNQLDNYEHGIKRSVTISNNDSIPLLIGSSDKKSIMASEYVLIEGPLQINPGAEFSIMIQNCPEYNIQPLTNQ